MNLFVPGARSVLESLGLRLQLIELLASEPTAAGTRFSIFRLPGADLIRATGDRAITLKQIEA
jgi:hypothetical protein